MIRLEPDDYDRICYDLPELTIDLIRAEVLKEDRVFQNSFSMELIQICIRDEVKNLVKLTADDWAECYLKAKQA